MKKLVFLVGCSAALTLGGCNRSNQDAVNNAELNQPAADDLNTLANDAASNAEDQSLGNAQQQQVNDQNAAADANSVNPTDAEENNVSAM